MNCLDENTVLAFLDGQLTPGVRAEIERHLADCRACLDLVSLAGSRTGQVWPGAHAELPGPTPRRRGSSIGRYVILDLVGRGGMGEVYAAYDPELDRRIALKLLDETGRGAGSSDNAGARLLREARVIARLSHPNVVVVHDAGTIDDRVFIAMEFVRGQTLSQWLSLQARSWPEIRDVFLAAGRGLMAAHAAGLIHRDFKPQNVMVGEDGAVRVTDFGLASEVVAGNDRTTDGSALGPDVVGPRRAPTLTRSGALLGTPLYMAPEQFRAEKADARTDQFSFCVALYEAVYGERPFPSGSLLILRRAVLAGEIRESPPRSRVPAWLRKIIVGGLAVDPAARYPSMAELLAALQRDPIRTRRRVLVGSLVASLLLGGGAVAQRSLSSPGADLCLNADAKLAGIWEVDGTAGNRPRRSATQRAFLATGKDHVADIWALAARRLDGFAQRWIQMHQQSCEATHRIGEQSAAVLDLRTDCLNTALEGLRAVTDLFANADDQVVNGAIGASQALPDLNRCADTPLLRALVAPPANPEQHAQVEELRRRLAVVRALGDLGKWDQSLRGAQQVVEEARSTNYQPILADALYQLALGQQQTGNLAAAAATYRLALPVAVAAHDDLVAAQISVLLTGLSGEMDLPEEGDSWAALGEAYLGRVGVAGDRTRAWLMGARGLGRHAQGLYAEAVALTRKAAVLNQKVMGGDSLDLAISYSNLAYTLLFGGDPAAALEESDRALELLEREAAPNSATLGTALSNRGDILNALLRPDEALPVFERCVAIWRASATPPNSPWYGFALTGIGQAWLLKKKPAQAMAPLERALVLREKGDPSPARLGETRFALAQALWDGGGDRLRAHRLALAARANYAGRPIGAPSVATIDRWLESHPSPRQRR